MSHETIRSLAERVSCYGASPLSTNMCMEAGAKLAANSNWLVPGIRRNRLASFHSARLTAFSECSISSLRGF